MATLSLGTKYFGLYRETSNAGVVNPDPIGYFSCRINVARFLDIDGIPTPVIERKVSKSEKTRDLTIVDSAANSLTKSDKNTDSVNEPNNKTLQLTRGTKRVRIKTGIKNANGNYKTVGFSFPSWATIKVIADALGTIIPPGKISATPSTTEIEGYFKLGQGGKYAIMLKAEAEASPDGQPITNSNISEIQGKSNSKISKGAS